MIECIPPVSELVGNAAWPVLSSATFARNRFPSRNDTEPAGVPLAELKTAPVNVTFCPTIEGFRSAVRVVLVEIPSSSKR